MRLNIAISQGRLHIHMVITMRVGGAIIAMSIRLSILVPLIVRVGVGVRLGLGWHWVCLRAVFGKAQAFKP